MNLKPSGRILIIDYASALVIKIWPRFTVLVCSSANHSIDYTTLAVKESDHAENQL